MCDEEIRCIGCGSILQDKDSKLSGYMPHSAFNKMIQEPDTSVYCQRCFRLRHYNEITPETKDPTITAIKYHTMFVANGATQNPP